MYQIQSKIGEPIMIDTIGLIWHLVKKLEHFEKDAQLPHAGHHENEAACKSAPIAFNAILPNIHLGVLYAAGLLLLWRHF